MQRTTAMAGLFDKRPLRVRVLEVTLGGVAIVVAWWALSEEEQEQAAGPTGAAAREAGAGPQTAPWVPFAPAGSLVQETDPVPSSVLRLLLSAPGGGRLCTFGEPEAPLPLGTVRCAGLDPDLAEARLPMLPADAPPMLMSGRGLRTAPGEAWWDAEGGTLESAFVAGDGRAAALLYDGERSLLVRIDGGAERARLEGPAVAPGTPALVWDRFLWHERREGRGDALHARPALADGEPVEIGEVAPESERMRGCRSRDALAVVVEGRIVHGVRQVWVTFHDGRGWTAPVGSEAGVYDYALTCRGREATMTWLMPGTGGDARQVAQVRCTPERCEKVVARATFAGSDPMVADLAGRVLLVWASEGVTRGRLAPAVELDAAPDLEEVPQPPGPVLSRRLFVRGGAAVLVHRTAEGLFATRIDAAGRSEPLGVREPGALSAP